MRKRLWIVMLLFVVLAAAHDAVPVDGIYQIEADVVPPKLKNQVDPDYPKGEPQRHESVTVKLRAVVNTEGSVTNIEVVGSAGAFDASAIAAIRQWRFKPAKHKGVAVPVRTSFEISFRWQDRAPGQ